MQNGGDIRFFSLVDFSEGYLKRDLLDEGFGESRLCLPTLCT